MQGLQLCVKCGLGSVRMGQCTESGGSLICPSHFFQRTVGGAGTGAEQMLSLGKLVGKFATKSYVLSSSCGVGH